MATRTAPAAWRPTGVAKYSRRTVVTRSGETRPTMPTKMVKRARSNAAILISFLLPERTDDFAGTLSYDVTSFT
jgi:hypothetical protein